MEIVHTCTIKDMGPRCHKKYNDDSGEFALSYIYFDNISHRLVQMSLKYKDDGTVITVNLFDLNHPVTTNITQINYSFPCDMIISEKFLDTGMIAHGNKVMFITLNDDEERCNLWIVDFIRGKVISHIFYENFNVNDFDENYIYALSEQNSSLKVLRAKYQCSSLIYETMIEIEDKLWRELYLRDNNYLFVSENAQGGLTIWPKGINFPFNNERNEFIGVLNLDYVLFLNKPDNTLLLHKWNSGQSIRIILNGPNDVLDVIDDNSIIFSYNYIENQKLTIWFHDNDNKNNIHEFTGYIPMF